MEGVTHEFLGRAGKLLNAGMTRTLVLTGNINDLFYSGSRGDEGTYVPLIELLTDTWGLSKKILIVYELNGPIRFVRESDRDRVKTAWTKFRYGISSDDVAIKRVARAKDADQFDQADKDFDQKLNSAIGQPTVALEFLRQLCLCSRADVGGSHVLDGDLIVIIEGADMLIPEGEVSRLSDADRHRVAIAHDWFSDPAFMQGTDAVVLIAESRSVLNDRIERLPQVLHVEIPSPNDQQRAHFITWFKTSRKVELKLWGSEGDLVTSTAALSIHALNQLLIESCYDDRRLEQRDVVVRVEDYIKSQLGDDVVSFKQPTHTFADVVGNRKLKRFCTEYLMVRFGMSGPGALSGAGVAGALGAGKTYIFEALASQLKMPVLELKNMRSQWYGQTDVLFERFRRVIAALAKVLIFMDEADTSLGGVGKDVHETERRLTGKVQAMMSDTTLRGKVIWLLMTARIHLLSPDLRRPGRVGDLIIPILDPSEPEDREEFLRWIVKPVFKEDLTPEQMRQLDENTKGYSAASFASLRSELIAIKELRARDLVFEDVVGVVKDHLPPPIGATRRYQELQALINCTKRQLLPNPDVTDAERRKWEEEAVLLERLGIR